MFNTQLFQEFFEVRWLDHFAYTWCPHCPQFSGKVEEHIIVKLYYFPKSVLGKGPTQLMIEVENGPLNAGNACNSARGGFDVVYQPSVKYVLQGLETIFLAPCQKKVGDHIFSWHLNVLPSACHDLFSKLCSDIGAGKQSDNVPSSYHLAGHRVVTIFLIKPHSIVNDFLFLLQITTSPTDYPGQGPHAVRRSGQTFSTEDH